MWDRSSPVLMKKIKRKFMIESHLAIQLCCQDECRTTGWLDGPFIACPHENDNGTERSRDEDISYYWGTDTDVRRILLQHSLNKSFNPFETYWFCACKSFVRFEGEPRGLISWLCLPDWMRRVYSLPSDWIDLEEEESRLPKVTVLKCSQRSHQSLNQLRDP